MTHVNLRLSVASFNTLMQALQELPFRVANPVVQEVMPQVEEQKRLGLAKGDQTEPALTGKSVGQ